MNGPSLGPEHTDALRHAVRNPVLLEALRRIIEEQVGILSEDVRAEVMNGSLHKAALIEGRIQGIAGFLNLLGRFG